MKPTCFFLAAGLLAAQAAPLRAEPPPPPAARPPATAAERAGLQAGAQAADAGVVIPPAALAAYRAAEPLALQAGNAERQLQALAQALRDYRGAYGQAPVGNNAEVARILRGGNPRGVRFADDSAAAVSEKGEILDRWGHALYFHPISAAVMEVRSAGPDGRMWTADDLVAR